MTAPPVRFGRMPLSGRHRATLLRLAAGHLTVVGGVALLAVLALLVPLTSARDVPDLVLFGGALVALGTAQVLALRHLRESGRALGPADVDIDALARRLHGAGVPIACVPAAALLTLPIAADGRLSPRLFALLVVLCAASLLLELARAAWTYRCLSEPRHRAGGTDPGGPVRQLPAGSGPVVRRAQVKAVAAQVVILVAAVVLLAVTIGAGTIGAVAAPAGALTAGIVSVLLPLAPIGSALLLRRALAGDTVALPLLHRAARLLVGAGAAGAVAAALVAAAVLAGPQPGFAEGSLLFVLVLPLTSAALQLASFGTLYLGDPPPPPQRHRRR